MPSAVGSNGHHQNNKKIGIMSSEFKSANHQQTNSWEIELYHFGLVNKMEESYTSPHTHTQAWKDKVIQIYSKTFHIRIESIMNGHLFTSDILDHSDKLGLMSNSKKLKMN